MSLLNIYNASTYDYEFVGFSFNGKHSSEFGLTAVVPSDMYIENLFADFDDRTVEVQGKDGAYYFGTQIKTKPLRLTVAFDNMNGAQKRNIINWLNPRKIGKLIFDEAPYKYYMVKITAPPTFSFVPFSEEKNNLRQHIYKGSFELEFVSFDPYGYSEYAHVGQVPVWNGSSYSTVYNDSNLPEWYLESGLFDIVPSATVVPNITSGFLIANSGVDIIPYNFYNGGNTASIVDLEFTVTAFNVGSTALLIKNNTNNVEFELKSLRNIEALSSHAGPWTIVCNSLTGQIYSDINSIRYNLGALHNGQFLLVEPGDNEWTTNRVLTNLKVKYRYTYW